MDKKFVFIINDGGIICKLIIKKDKMFIFDIMNKTTRDKEA